MITNNEFASRVINAVKALNKDTRISKRYVIETGKIKANFLMVQKMDELTMSREDGVITTIDCFRLKADNVKECDIFEFRRCKSLMKSCKKLPKGLFGKSGSGIISVSNIDGSKNYHYITPKQYALLDDRSLHRRRNMVFYFVKDDYLYLPESRNELVEISMITFDTWEADKCSECENKTEKCESALSAKFVCPDRFLDLVVRDTIQEIASITMRIPADENPNLDENQKTQTSK